MSAPVRERNVLHHPLDWDPAPYLAQLNHPGKDSGEWRREACRVSPLLFQMMYLPHTLSSPETNGQVSVSEFHLEACTLAKAWMRTDIRPGEVRDALVAPRGSGKSTLAFKVLPLWALAYGWRKFILAFAHAGPQARLHLLSLKRELDSNERLRADFPELCAPRVRTGGRSAMDSQDSYLASSGVAMMVRGMDAATLGVKIDDTRPDLILLDDIEPDASNYSIDQKNKRLESLRNAILPMNYNAAVLWAGTCVVYDSLVHNLVRGADWVTDEGFTCYHYPAIVADPVTGEERSLWPQRWDLDYLRSRRVDSKGKLSRSYALNMDNNPIAAEGTLWSEDDFTFDAAGALARAVTRKVLALDPAVTAGKGSDATGLAVIGYAPIPGKCLVERATGVHMSPAEIEGIVHRMLEFDPLIREVVVELNNGGEYIVRALEPLPRGVRLVAHRASESKSSRVTSLYYRYQAGQVVHAKPLPEYQVQACAFRGDPRDSDDILDAVEAGVRHLMGKYEEAA